MQSTSYRQWELPELTNVHRLPMTSCLVPFDDAHAARSYDRTRSTRFMSLNGTWRFKLYDRPEDVPADALSTDFADADHEFRDIPVPSNWTLQDTGDKPIYTNVQMPWENNPPFVPDRNPTGVYRTAFELPEGWHGRRVVIHVGGVESYYELTVNGIAIGMAKDTRLPSEFDLSDALVPGTNTIAFRVIRWSDSSYIEDQDQWWMAGIYRDVYLYRTESAFIEDIFAKAGYDAVGKSGSMEVDVLFGYRPVGTDDPGVPHGPAAAYRIDAELFDADDASIWTATSRVDPSYRISEYHQTFSAEFPGIRPWSSEDPALYRLVLSLRDGDGRHVESRCVRVGFRTVEIRDRELLINGKAVLIRGVNRHEHDERTGKVMTRELMLRDIRTLKAFNFNAVRTSHYPNTMEWYDLCDEYGIYLVDEANIESHANYATICRDPRWRRAFEERMTRMVLRDRNHPSIIAWSAGNESGHGPNHASAIDLVRALDPTRVIHHEGEVKRRWTQSGNEYDGGSGRYNDLVNPMYPSIESIIEHATAARDPRPVILCEYSHAMGNSNGSLAEYWDAFERYKGLQGGFIWEWVDHGILQHDASGRPYWAYGGDFGETIHDGNFVADGLVWPDRTPHPGIHEFKKVAQPLAVIAGSVAEGRFTIRSKQDFTSLSWLEGSWRVEVEGELIETGTVPELDVPPGGELPIEITYARPRALEQPEAYVTFSFVTKQATPWCEEGHEVAWEQFRANHLRVASPPATAVPNVASIRLGKDGTPTFAVAGREVIAAWPTVNLFRATTDNDGIRGWDGQEHKPMGLWLAAGFDRLIEAGRVVTEEPDGTGPTIHERTTYTGSDTALPIVFEQWIRELAPGVLRFDVTIDAAAGLPTLPRIGVILQTVPGFEELRWFGRGPYENHIDRRAGYPVGRYEGTVAEQYVPYIMPQENGSKCDVRWFELSDGEWAIRFEADPLFEFSAHHFTPLDLFSCRHTNEVEDRLRPETVVSIDLRQRGVGTGSCGPQTRGPYCIAAGRYEFGFVMSVRRETATGA